jgi:hypothetical protein
MYSSNDFKFRAVMLYWYSTPVKDGVLRQRAVFKLCVQKHVFGRFSYDFIVTFHQHWQPKICYQFIETRIQLRIWT